VLCSWAKERLKEGKGGKEAILSKPLRPGPRESCSGGSLLALNERQLLSKLLQRMRGFEWALVW